MTVLVTGGNGLIGSFVVRKLIELGYRPKLILRANSDNRLLYETITSCEVLEGDVLDPMLLENGMANCEMVIHCAGVVSYDPRRKNEIFKVNVEGTANVVNACLKSGIKKLVHVSSIAALGKQYNSLEINEKTKWEDSDLNSSYAKSKYLAELEVYRGGEEGLDFSIVNPSIVIGSGDLNKSSTKLLGLVMKMPKFFPAGFLNIVDVRDVANAICGLLKIEHRERLVLNTTQISYKDFYKLVCDEAGIQVKSIQVPSFVIHLIAFYSRIKSFFVGGEPIITKENARFIDKKFYYNSLYYSKLFPSKSYTASESIKWAISGLKSKTK